jgi:hypothetical protein
VGVRIERLNITRNGVARSYRCPFVIVILRQNARDIEEIPGEVVGEFGPIMSARHLTVVEQQMALNVSGLRSSSVYAGTVLARENGVLIAADVFLSHSSDTVELIAHEVEHILELLDEVDLAAQVGAGHVCKRTDGAFETQRAIAAGRRVAREVAQRPDARERARWRSCPRAFVCSRSRCWWDGATPRPRPSRDTW